jgi:hypothetical protein
VEPRGITTTARLGRVGLAALAVVVAASLAGCVGTSDGTGRERPATAREVVERNEGDVGVARSATCLTEKASLEAAADSYELLRGEPPQATPDLVPDFLRELPSQWSLTTVDGERHIEPTDAGIRNGCR